MFTLIYHLNGSRLNMGLRIGNVFTYLHSTSHRPFVRTGTGDKGRNRGRRTVKVRGLYISIAVQALSGTKVEEEMLDPKLSNLHLFHSSSISCRATRSDSWLRWYIFIFIARLLLPWTSSLCTHPRVSILSWSDIIYLGDSHHYDSCISITTGQCSYLKPPSSHYRVLDNLQDDA